MRKSKNTESASARETRVTKETQADKGHKRGRPNRIDKSDKEGTGLGEKKLGNKRKGKQSSNEDQAWNEYIQTEFAKFDYKPMTPYYKTDSKLEEEHE